MRLRPKKRGPSEAIVYRLPVTFVRISGTRTRITTDLDLEAVRYEREGRVDVEVVADPESSFELRVPEGSGWDKESLNLSLWPDGRITGATGDVTDQSGARTKAIVTVGTAVAGTALALGAPPLAAVAAGLAIGGAAGAGAHPMIEELDATSPGVTDTGTAPEEPEDEDPAPESLGIHPRYEAEHQADHALLYRYRLALLRLTAEHAEVAVEPSHVPGARANLLNLLGQALRRTRAEAALVEQRYEAWLKSKQTFKVDRVDIRLYADEVPTSEDLREALRQPAAARKPAWWDAVEDLRTMATIDYLDDPPTPVRQELPKVAPGHVVYRSPRPAWLTTWKIVPSNNTQSGMFAEVERSDRVLVTPSGTERTLPILAENKKGSLEIGLDTSGALVKLAVSRESAPAQRAQALAEVPAAVQSGLDAGNAIGTALSPSALKLQRLKREVELAEQRAKLKGPAAPPEDLKRLSEELEKAELEARLQVAELLRRSPSEATIVFGWDGGDA